MGATNKGLKSRTIAVSKRDDGEQPSPTNTLWQAALDRYFAELRKGGIKRSVIEKNLWSIGSSGDLLAQVEALVPTDSEVRTPTTGANILTQLQSILLSLNDFTMVVSRSLGIMNGEVAALLWGSIGLMVKLAQSVLPDLVAMLEELQRALPRIRKNEEQLPMTEALQRALLDVYSEIIVFCAQTTTFLRNNPNIGRSRHVWSQFNRDFPSVVSSIRSSSRRVDELTDMIRLPRKTQTGGTEAAIQGVRELKTTHVNVDLPCYVIPYGLNLRFFGRDKDIRTLRDVLDPKGETEMMKCVAIHGLGGVGKTQLALHYANTSMKLYDIIVWIRADNHITIVQGLSSFTSKLGLSSGREDDHQSIQQVRDWLNVSGKSFLLVFDNVADDNVLEQIWPASPSASVIITTRSLSVASRRTTNILSLECFDGDAGPEVLYALTGNRPSCEKDMAAATEICHLLGGLPLAMNEASGFMGERGCSYEEFLWIYRKSAEKIFAKSKPPIEYKYTTLTTWDTSLERLSNESRILQNLLAFFDPDSILERLITDTKAGIIDARLGFLFDDFDFGQAVMELTRSSLVRRIAGSKALSVHRLVQFVVFGKLSTAEWIVYFDTAIQILYHGFPNTWNLTGPQQGHGFEAWETCGAVLAHISWLMALSETYMLRPTNPTLWAELVFRAGTYLWEKEQPARARSFFKFGLGLNIGRSTSIAAQAYRLLGHVCLDLSRPRAALQAYQKALSIRQQLEKPDSPRIADIYDSIACSYTEMGDVSQAFKYLTKAEAIHRTHDSGKGMARTEAIYAMAYLRAGRPNEALGALRKCWERQGLTQEQVATSEYPKHSGDMVLLARIYWALGDWTEGHQLAARTIKIRRNVYGENGGPRVADSLFMLARMLQDKGEYVLAAKLLCEIVEISGGMVEMRRHLARALWFHAGIERMIGSDGEVCVELRQRAKEEREGIEGREGSDTDSDDGFMGLVSWMLW